MKNTNKYFEEINITHNDITQKTKEELKEITKLGTPTNEERR